MSGFLSSLEQVVLFLLVFGVMVGAHELGHFLTGKAFDVRVDVFSFGFGPKIWSHRRGETEYRVAAIPLGGYVLWAGDVGDESGRPRHPRDFDAQPVLVRLAIFAAGPLFSALLAVLLMWGVYVAGMRVPAYLGEAPRIGQVAEGSTAEAAGLRSGDVVLRAAGREVPTWEDLSEVLVIRPDSIVDLEVERAGERLVVPVQVVAEGKHRIGTIGADPCALVTVEDVTDGSAADAAGVRPGDVVVAADGVEPCSPAGLVARVQASEGRPVALDLRRDGQPLRISVTPTRAAEGRWLLGVMPGIEMVTQRHGVLPALAASVRFNVDKGRFVAETFGKLFTGRLSFRAMSGPMEMASITQQTARLGWRELVMLVSFISLNLAIFNLIAIPILDGGRILLLVIEAIRGREMRRRTKEWILGTGLAMIVLLTVVVLVLDGIKKWEG